MKAKDINGQRFEKAAFGYKQEDVDNFLAEIAQSYEQLFAEKEAAEEKMEVLASIIESQESQEFTGEITTIRKALPLATQYNSSRQNYLLLHIFIFYHKLYFLIL